MMSSFVDQQEKYADDGDSEMSVSLETDCLKSAESSDCLSSGILSDSPKVCSEPRDEDECQRENILTLPVKQDVSKRQTDDIERPEDETSDCTHLLDSHCSRTNGESSFENENCFQADDMFQPQAHTEVGSTQDCKNTEEKFYQCINSYESPRNSTGSRKITVQPEILLQPLSLCAGSSRPALGSEEELEANSLPSVRFKKPMGSRKHSSPTAKHGREDLEADSSTSVHFIKETDTRKHSSSKAVYCRTGLGSDSSLNVNFMKSAGIREHSSPSAEHSREDLRADSPSSVHFIKTTSTRVHFSPTAEHGRAELGVDPPGTVRFIKPTSTRQHSSPASGRGAESRDIFESGGQQMRNLPEGTSYSGPGLEEIEHLSVGESSPEPQIVISPTSSDDPHVNLFLLAKDLFFRWLGFLKQRTCRQFAKAPLFYLFSTFVIMTSITVADNLQRDRDISLAILFSFAIFILITLGVDRGQYSHVLGGGKSSIPECKKACRNSDTCIPWCCCQSEPEPHLERHSQYRHLEEDGAFKHEIADVSRLDPKDCPRIKMVELRGSEHEESPDCPPEVSQVNADVHVGKRDGEKLGARRKHQDMDPARTSKQHKSRSNRPRLGASKTFKVDIHASSELSSPELSPIQETTFDEGKLNGEEQPMNSDASGISTLEAENTPRNNLEDDAINNVDLGGNKSSNSTKNSPRFSGGDDFKKFTDCSPTLPRFVKIRPSDCHQDESGRSTSPEDESFPELQDSNDIEFMCEHYGQGVACSCAAMLKKEVENMR